MLVDVFSLALANFGNSNFVDGSLPGESHLPKVWEDSGPYFVNTTKDFLHTRMQKYTTCIYTYIIDTHL